MVHDAFLTPHGLNASSEVVSPSHGSILWRITIPWHYIELSVTTDDSLNINANSSSILTATIPSLTGTHCSLRTSTSFSATIISSGGDVQKWGAYSLVRTAEDHQTQLGLGRSVEHRPRYVRIAVSRHEIVPREEFQSIEHVVIGRLMNYVGELT